MAEPRILVIDDDASFNGILTRALQRRGFDAFGAQTPTEAQEQAAVRHPEGIVLDLNLAGNSGLALIPTLLAHCPGAHIVVLTGYASISTAVDAIKLGAQQYLAKPADIDAIIIALTPATDTAHAEASNIAPDTRLSVDRLEWEHIQQVLKAHDGNISATARALHMHRRTLQRKLTKRPKTL